jgi:hypothetical protein
MPNMEVPFRGSAHCTILRTSTINHGSLLSSLIQTLLQSYSISSTATVPSFILSIGTFSFLVSARYHVSRPRDLSLVEHSAIVQQNFTVAPPFPILEIGWNHTLSTIAINATKARNASITVAANNRLQSMSPSPPPLSGCHSQMQRRVSLRRWKLLQLCKPSTSLSLPPP